MSTTTEKTPVRRPRPARNPNADRIMAVTVLLLALSIVPFAGIIGQEFTAWDDEEYVTGNPTVTRGLTPAGIKWAFTTDHASNYHPLTWLSLMTDFEIFGANASAFKVINLLLHAANSLLLFAFFAQATKRWIPSFFVAALFACHPLHVESVVWVAERKDVLSTLFALAAMNAYLWYVKRADWRFYGLMIVAFIASLLSKQMYVTLPLVLLLFDEWPLGRLAPREASIDEAPEARKSLVGLIVEKAPLFVLAALAGLLIVIVQRLNPSILSADMNVGQRFMNAVYAYGVYLWQMVWPMNLAYFYPLPADGYSIVDILLPSAVVVGMTIAAFLFRDRAPYLFVGWLWYLVTLAPVAGFIRVGFQAHADRYTYFPLIGIFVIIVWGVAELIDSRALSGAGTLFQRQLGAIAGGAVVLALFAAVTFRQVQYWDSTETLATRGLEIAPDSFYAKMHIGKIQLTRGEWDEARANLEGAVAQRPDLVPALVLLADLALADGDVPKAVKYIEDAEAIAPNNLVVLYEHGLILLGQQKLKPATEKLTKAIQINPGIFGVRVALANAMAQQKNYKEASRLLQRVADFNYETRLAFEAVEQARLVGGPPEENRIRRLLAWPPTVNGSKMRTMVAARLTDVGKRKEALAELDKAIKLWPNNMDAIVRLASLHLQMKDERGTVYYLTQLKRLAADHPDGIKLQKGLDQLKDEKQQSASDASASVRPTP